jgi:hypothetical protein
MAKFRMKKDVDGYKPGPHRLLIPGQPPMEIEAGMEVECDPEYLKNVMHKFEIIEPDAPAANPQTAKLTLKKRDGGNSTGYDLINPVTGDPINTNPLKKADAELLAQMTMKEALELLEPKKTPPSGETGSTSNQEGSEQN